MKDRQIIKKQVEKLDKLDIVQDLNRITLNIIEDLITYEDISTLYIALNQLKELYNLDDNAIKKAYNIKMKSIRETLCK